MILVDTGPLIALFDPQDALHVRCVAALKRIREPIATTTPVLTEAFHILGPASIGSDRLREFIEQDGMSVWFLNRTTLTRAFELMELYADHPMDLVDASLVTAAETLGTRRVFTIDSERLRDVPRTARPSPSRDPDRRLTFVRRPTRQRSTSAANVR